jgi:hypothetical protein
MGLIRQVEGGLELTDAMQADYDYQPPEPLHTGHDDYFKYTQSRNDIALSTLWLDFGSSPVNPGQPMRKTITVTNNAKGPVTFLWHHIFAKNMQVD